MCSPWVFPIAPCFNLICFVQSPPLLRYIGGPKREALHLSIESSIFVRLHSFNFFCQGQSNSIKKSWTCENTKKVGLGMVNILGTYFSVFGRKFLLLLLVLVWNKIVGILANYFWEKRGISPEIFLLSAAQLISSSLWFASLSFCSVTN
jgi:hypothetical protein